MAEEKKKDLFDLSAGVPQVEGEMRPKPKLADRLSWRIGAAVGVFLMIVMGLFFWGLSGVGEKKAPTPGKAASGDKKDAPVGSSVPKDLQAAAPADGVPAMAGAGAEGGEAGGRTAGTLVNRVTSVFPSFGGASAPVAAGVAGHGKAGKGDGVPGVDWSGLNTGKVPPVSGTGSGGQIPKEGQPGVSGAPLTPAQQAAEQEKSARMARMAQARTGGMSSKSFDEGAPPVGGQSDALKSQLMKMAADAQKGGGAGTGGAAAMPGAGQKGADAEQDEKLAFLQAAEKAPRNYHPYVPLPPLSPNEIKEGTSISLVMEGGMNSNLPGQITARSTDDVYDSVTGCRLLLPASTQFIGRYDSKVAIGQDRQLFVWNSAIFRNGDELNLAGMQGYDMAGQSGLQSEVDNHYMRLFGLAFGMSMVTAGVQLSVPQPTTGPGNTGAQMSSAQVVSTALAQQYGQLGAQILGKYMNVQPTLRNFPGERFTILVPHTIVFSKVWRNRCTARAKSTD